MDSFGLSDGFVKMLISNLSIYEYHLIIQTRHADTPMQSLDSISRQPDLGSGIKSVESSSNKKAP
ncbi:hypothetical protein [Cycloclasticus sp.]|uniref:hypothetical protein n=1 Tax=Cycloclasticus sp. TaxID=2024830 RepID=UPI000C10C5A8|nr:hypothetical protein [Cycloclasticus sp.]PHR51555.1 MAG: hypothetical protein COA48_00325 [Cycloclasticus sp.]